MLIDGKTRLAAVIGNPIKHSLSPFIHNLSFQKTGINGMYLAFELLSSDIEITLETIKRFDMFGLNVSMPYKQAVLPFLDSISNEAQLMGAVNTICLKEGQLIGYNTDGLGFLKSLEDQVHFLIKEKTMVIIGSGSAATAIIVQAAIEGVTKIIIFTKESYLDETKQRMTLLAKKTKTTILTYSLAEKELFEEIILSADLLVNATRIGMDGKSLALPSHKMRLPKKLLVADVIYHPLETPLIAYAKQQGLTTLNGLGMLLYQAALSFELWTGGKMPVEEIWPLLESHCQTH
ncbi:shikimate dehydrogenase [Streptococcus pacificus]|uniref:Shikimate dehydrogenase (NADP(+)) n=1 Tax=Streptococcus pacificus TaxID=2740577 RepID=A0ABS0ZGV1_9STRE|nr:shikimate dehydrogenase [Streptococcus pacificus]MBJ8325230.1 shikimate dehydrogenase [Streptococcus pacificus]